MISRCGLVGPMCSSMEMDLWVLAMCSSVEMDLLVLCVPPWKWTCGSYPGFLCGSGFVGSTCIVSPCWKLACASYYKERAYSTPEILSTLVSRFGQQDASLSDIRTLSICFLVLLDSSVLTNWLKSANQISSCTRSTWKFSSNRARLTSSEMVPG